MVKRTAVKIYNNIVILGFLPSVRLRVEHRRYISVKRFLCLRVSYTEKHA